MFALLKKNICISLSYVPLNEEDIAADEKVVEVKDGEDTSDILGKKYENGTFVENDEDPIVQELEKNRQRRLFLKNTDWKVMRHKDQLELGIETSLTDEEYKELLKERQKVRGEIAIITSEEILK